MKKAFDFRKILGIFIELSYLSVVFFVPLYFAAILHNNDIFELNKIVLFKILVLFLLLFSFLKFIFYGSFKNIISKKFLLFSIPVFLYLFSLIISTILSSDFNTSYYGLYSRFQGLESYIYYLLFFFLIILNLVFLGKELFRRKINNILIAILLSSFFVSLYGVAQRLGIDFFTWSEDPLITKRVISTLGQPNFVASYLILVAPITFYFLFKFKKFIARFFVLILLFFQITCLALTGSRGGVLGFVFSVFVLVFIFLFYKKEYFRKIFGKRVPLVLALVFLLITSSLYIFRGSSFAQRFISMKDLQSGSIAPRINFWNASIDAIKDRPILGYGLDMQNQVLAKYYEKDWAINGDINIFPNRAHNFVLDILLTTGFVGLIFYLLILFEFSFLALNNFRKNNSKISLFLFIGVIAYFFSVLFNFATVVTQIYFWLYFAIVFSIFIREYIKDEYRVNNLNIILKLFFALTLSGLIFYQINQELKYLKADHYFVYLNQAYTINHYFKVLELNNYIKEANIKADYYDKNIADVISAFVENNEGEHYKKLGNNELDLILQRTKTNNYSDILTRAEIFFAFGDFDEAEALFKRAIELSPEMPKNYRKMAIFYHNNQKYQEAEKYYNLALEFLPDFNSPYMNSRHTQKAKYERYLIYKSLGNLYFEQENYKEAEKYYKLALNDDITDIVLLKKIADTLYKRGDIEKAIFYNQHGMVRNPKDYVWPYTVSLLFSELKDVDNCEKYFNLSLAVLPSNISPDSLNNECKINYED